ncbi:uncharacterized protein [Coffea arabica]|uniref:Retrotransposon gag domain-containing protein n=1 Tax=Coffea arabica TaxID=13443 RepID=A0A6P6VCS1_COFAR|nr:uncharacterized protein LOC113719405 [Coffea arabica]
MFKATSKIASLSKAFSRGLLGRRADEEPQLLGRFEVDYMRAPPFTDEINEERFPSNFKLPTIASYDSRGDPKDHFHAFISAFRLYCIPDPVICQAFPVPTTKTSAHLLNIQQNSGESLRSYVQRFQDESVQIPDPNEQVTIAVFTNSRGLQSPGRDRRSVFNRIAKGKPPVLEAKLTPLNTSRSPVLSVMDQNGLGRAPPKMNGKKERRNPDLYCLYHRDVGHETEDCNDLKNEIERLIKQGYLKQFIRRDASGPKDAKRPPRDGSPGHGLGYETNIAGVINTIACGPTGGDNQNSRKRTYQQANPNLTESSSRLSEVITYCPSDPVPATSSSHEALVIEVLANNYVVKKVYVDPGSSVDVM